MKIYTKKGDKGQTSLIGGTRVSKAHLRLEAYGTVDELNSHIGLVRSFLKKEDAQFKILTDTLNNLFVVGALLAEDPEKSKMQLPPLPTNATADLEAAIDAMNADLEVLRAFILPAGNDAVGHCHVARCVCRRAERNAVRLGLESEVDENVIMYLNRLSDYLFTLARKVGKDFGVEEVKWLP